MPKDKKSKSKSKDKRSKSKSKKDKKEKKPSKGKSSKSGKTLASETALQVLGAPVGKHCIQHQSELVYFCESCEEPICSLCTTLGPHNNQLHRVNSISKAYSTRLNKLDYLIKTCLV